MAKNKKISNLKSKVFYGIGNLGYGAVSQTYTNFIMFFGTSVLKISGSLMGIAVAIATIWDAVTDPIIGFSSDKSRSRLFGRRHGFLLAGIYGMAICNLIIWGVPQVFSTTAKFIWVFVGMILLESFNTFFATPYNALGAEITNEYNERTEIQMYKTIAFLIALALPTVFLKIFLPDTPEFPQGQLNPQGYLNMAYVTSAICLICGFIMFIGTYNFLPRWHAKARKEKQLLITQSKKSTWESLKDFGRIMVKKNFRNVIFGYSIALVSAAILTGVGMHFFTYTFHFNSSQLTLTLASLLAGTVIGQPLWLFVSKKKEKKPALLSGILTSFIGIVGMFIVFLCRAKMSTSMLLGFTMPCVLISGIGTGALYSMPISMYNDLIAIEHERTKEEKTATYSSAMTLAFKASNAIASLGIGFMLDLIKFDAEVVEQTATVQSALGWFVFIGIALSLLVGFFCYKGYNITKDQVPTGFDTNVEEYTIDGKKATISASGEIENVEENVLQNKVIETNNGLVTVQTEIGVIKEPAETNIQAQESESDLEQDKVKDENLDVSQAGSIEQLNTCEKNENKIKEKK